MSTYYDRPVYERTFARLLDRSLAKGKNDPAKALKWLNRPFRYALAVTFTVHRLETTDAFLDVREHLSKRIELLGGTEKEGLENE